MSLKETRNILSKENNEESYKNISTSFAFNNTETNNQSGPTLSTSDSAYNSMVCSPFSPVVSSKSPKIISPIFQKRFPAASGSISPFLETSEHDEVFNMSMEQICNETFHPVSEISVSHMASATFRPISSGGELVRFDSLTRETSSEVQIRQFNQRVNLTSQRSISTQTKFSMGSNTIYRPNSAPLQEGVEEELEELYISRIMSTNYRIHRNSTCNSIRSPMPDLIQPAFQNNNNLLASKLSLIADQIDESIHPQLSATRNVRRTRRFSTPSLANVTPGGSVFDLILSIYNAFDNTVPSQEGTTRPSSHHN